MEDAALALEALQDELRETPTAFGFFQAVLLLERFLPHRESVGGAGDPAAEAVRFATGRGIAFPASEIQSLVLEDDGPARMTVNFMGVTGPLGVLPYHYSLLAAERVRARDTGLADFLDLFNHRMVSLFFRAWKKNQPATSVGGSEDILREHVLDLVGMGLPGLRTSLGFEENSLVFYAGLLSDQHRSAAGLQQLLADHFDVPVEVKEFVGGWHPLGERDLCALGVRLDASSQLGLGAVVGDEVWDPQSRVRIRIGPLDRARYADFLPGGPAFERLRELARFYGNDQYEFELQLVLARDEVPGCVLGADDGPPQPLGWSTWLRSAPFPTDADQTILRL